MTFEITLSRTTVERGQPCQAQLTASEPFDAIEVRATRKDASYGRGIGIDVLADTLPTEQGVYTLPEPATEFSFDVKSSELTYGYGDYDVTVYVRDMRGLWNDTLILSTSDGYDIETADGYLITLQKE